MVSSNETFKINLSVKPNNDLNITYLCKILVSHEIMQKQKTIYQIRKVFLFTNLFENKFYIKVGDMEDKIISQSKQNSLYTTNNRPLRRFTNEKNGYTSRFQLRKTALSCLGDGSGTSSSIVDRQPI